LQSEAFGAASACLIRIRVQVCTRLYINVDNIENSDNNENNENNKNNENNESNEVHKNVKIEQMLHLQEAREDLAQSIEKNIASISFKYTFNENEHIQ